MIKIATKSKNLMLQAIRKEISFHADPKRAEASKWFFKTGKGQYGEGDRFLGLSVPLQRQIAKKYKDAGFAVIEKLLASPYHEHRFVALEILVMQYERGGKTEKKNVYNFYLKHTKGINNWDLVDTSASYIVGQYLLNCSRKILYRLARSKNLWERRIAVISTMAFIARDDFSDTLNIATLLLADKHDLIHKAVGWCLREVGKRDLQVLRAFLNKHRKAMPRTALRYAIEKMAPMERQKYLGI